MLVTRLRGLVLVPDIDVRSPLILKRVSVAKNGKNRMHIDIIRDDPEAEVVGRGVFAIVRTSK